MSTGTSIPIGLSMFAPCAVAQADPCVEPLTVSYELTLGPLKVRVYVCSKHANQVAAHNARGAWRRNTSKVRRHVVEIFDQCMPGTFLTVEDIAATRSSEYGPNQLSPVLVIAALKHWPYSVGKKDKPTDIVEVIEQDGQFGGRRVS